MGRPRGWSRLYVRNWRVRTKLAAVLLIPSLAFLAVGGLELHTAFQATRTLDGYADRVALSREVTELVHQVQQERDRTAGALVAVDRSAGATTAVGEFSAVTGADWRAVNTASAAYRRAAQPVAERLGGAFRSRVDAAGAALEDLAELRNAAAEGQLRNDAVFDGYSRVIAALLRILPEAGAAGEDPAVDRSVRGLHDLAQAKELQSQVRGQLQGIATAGGFRFGEYQSFADLRARRAAALERFRADADAGQLATYENQVKGQAVLATTRLERAAADRAQGDGPGFEAEQWWSASTTQVELFRAAERELADAAVTVAERFAAAAGQRARTVAAIVAVILVVALVTSFLVGRSMAGSLRRLRRRALVVAERDLPEAIRRINESPLATPNLRVESTSIDAADEIGEVAEAFDAVHRSAVRLALEQAALRRDVSAMFINLARRSQVLVGRQLTLLDELESDEQDPDRLARFFALDHLATRMRRNDENLLVLAASDTHRLWREPVPLSRLLLGAVAETEDYRRIESAGPDDVVVAGHVVPDLMHLIAELLDNATTFSPPGTPVLLSARTVRGLGGTEAVVTVEDSGMGMTQSMLAEANTRLAQPPAIDAAVSERMGHVVVSHLAARHGMRVELRGAPGGGVTASIALPTAVLAAAEPADRIAAAEPAAAGPDDVTQNLAQLVATAATRDGEEEAPPAPATAASRPEPEPEPEPEPAAPAISPAGLPQRSPAAGLPRRGAAPEGERTSAAPGHSGGWWSGDGSGWRSVEPTKPDTAATNAAGLPVRVPRATLPARAAAPVTPAGVPTTAAEPDAVAEALARFHRGVQRADEEDPASLPS